MNKKFSFSDKMEVHEVPHPYIAVIRRKVNSSEFQLNVIPNRGYSVDDVRANFTNALYNVEYVYFVKSFDIVS